MKINKTFIYSRNNNSFEELAFNYDNYIKKLKEIGTIEKGSKIFRLSQPFSIAPIIIDEINSWLKIIKSTLIQDIHICENGVINNDWLDLVRDYSAFLRTAEKCWLYYNDTSNNISSCVDENKKNYILFVDLTKAKVKITFEKTEIPNISTQTNLLEEFIDNNELSDSISTVEINIVREFGKKMCNIFNYIKGSTLDIDLTDEILLNDICVKISYIIMENFEQILNSINDSNYINIEDSSNPITFREVINNEIRVRRYSRK